MNVTDAIAERKSIRKFEDRPLSQEAIDKILLSATLAPSGKNKQPWKFYVVRGEKREEMVQTMQKGMDRLKEVGIKSGSAKYTIRWMAQAPVTIFVFNPTGPSPFEAKDLSDPFTDIVDVQSVGAAIQNMLLTATELGLGSLWICDVYAAYDEFCDWLKAEGQLVAAVSIGYPAQTPQARPRKSIDEVTVYV
jgi:nitroreductase